MSLGPHIPAGRLTGRPSNGSDFGDRAMLQDNFDLCNSIDLTKLSVVLERMVEDQGLSKQLASIYYMQAASLLAAIRTENHRLHNY